MCDNQSSSCSNNFKYKRELTFKYVVIGDYGVGKTSCIKRYAEDTFSTTYKITIGADFALKTIDWDEDTTLSLQLWDISGYERFGCLTSVYYRYALGAAVVFDLTRPNTIESTEKWIADLRSKRTLPNGDDIPVILLANKGDIALENVPPTMDEFCKKNNILMWYVTSAKENINLDLAMGTLIKHTLENDTYKNRDTREPILLEEKPQTVNAKRRCFF